jgi:hypothetical protein
MDVINSNAFSGLKILVIELYDKMFDDFKFGSDISIVVSDGCPKTMSSVWLRNKYECKHKLISAQFGKVI